MLIQQIVSSGKIAQAHEVLILYSGRQQRDGLNCTTEKELQVIHIILLFCINKYVSPQNAHVR